MARLGHRWPAWATLSIAAGAILLSTGIGFAAFTATATVHGAASPASFGLVITSVTEAAGAPWVSIQTTHLPATTVSAWLNDTTVGSIVLLEVVIQNIGTVPANNIAFDFSTHLSGPSTCSVGTFMYPTSTNVPAGATLPAGASFASYWHFEAGPDLSTCAGGVPYFGFTISYVATAGV